jgi:hypothetical protein
MDVRRLSRLLYDLDIPPSRYRLDGSHFELAHVLDRRGDGWVVFLSERGGESGAVAFDSEHVACAYLLGRVFGDLAEQGSLRFASPRTLPTDVATEPPGHLAGLVAALLRNGFDESYRDEQSGPFGSFMRVYERDPVRVRVIWDGKEREWIAALNSREWPPDAWGEVWVTLPPTVKIPR